MLRVIMVIVPVAFLLGDDDTFLLRCVMSMEGLVDVLLLACTMGRSPRLLYYVVTTFTCLIRPWLCFGAARPVIPLVYHAYLTDID